MGGWLTVSWKNDLPRPNNFDTLSSLERCILVFLQLIDEVGFFSYASYFVIIFLVIIFSESCEWEIDLWCRRIVNSLIQSILDQMLKLWDHNWGFLLDRKMDVYPSSLPLFFFNNLIWFRSRAYDEYLRVGNGNLHSVAQALNITIMQIWSPERKHKDSFFLSLIFYMFDDFVGWME